MSGDGQRGRPRNAGGRHAKFNTREEDAFQMGYAAKAPANAPLVNDGGGAYARRVSESTSDDPEVWDDYLSYLADCARDSGAAACCALPGDDSDPDDDEEQACIDEVVESLCARARA